MEPVEEYMKKLADEQISESGNSNKEYYQRIATDAISLVQKGYGIETLKAFLKNPDSIKLYQNKHNDISKYQTPKGFRYACNWAAKYVTAVAAENGNQETRSAVKALWKSLKGLCKGY